MRLLLPLLDKERPAYGLKEARGHGMHCHCVQPPQSALARLYIEILAISAGSVDGERLLNWRIPDVARQAAGDFAGLCALILSKRCPAQGRCHTTPRRTTSHAAQPHGRGH